ncbi:MAG TPA: hypothetical protein VLH85_04875 [Levilinea sp.]|nr:hypothetical protein [Levilinea sp.]
MNRPANKTDTSLKPSLLILFSLAALAALASVYALVTIPADPKNSVLFGFSIQRLALIAAMGFLSASCALAALLTWRDNRHLVALQRFVLAAPRLVTWLIWLSGLTLLVSAVALNLPLYQYGRFQSNIERLKPILAWFAFSSGVLFLALLRLRFGFNWKTFRKALAHDRPVLRCGLLLSIFFLSGALWMSLTGTGIQPDEDFWYEAGVPILGLQILAAWLVTLAMVALTNRYSRWPLSSKRADLLIFLVLWIVIGAVWAAEPLRSSFFAPGPYYPNENFAPFSDAAVFNMRAQFALIGQGYNNDRYFDRGLYPAFLALLHVIGGQQYPLVMAIQAAVFAVLPAALYWLGAVLVNRPVGIFIALLAAARGVNSIASATLINSVHPKVMMTDFATGVLLGVFTLWAVRWLLKPTAGLKYAVLAGGALGFASLVRTNVLFALPLLLAAALFVYRKSWAPYLLAAALVSGAMFFSILPWGLRSVERGAPSIFHIYTGRFAMAENSRMPEIEPDPPAVREGNAETPSGNRAESSPLELRIQRYIAFAPVAANHFVHNLVTSFFILPTQAAFHDLHNTVRGQAPFWEPAWDGSGITPEMQTGIVLNLLVLAFGISAAWQAKKATGLLPLLVFLGYAAANALARTSGGRYIVPMDWVILVYYAIGLYQVTVWALALLQKQPQNFPFYSIAQEKPATPFGQPFIRQALPVIYSLMIIIALGALIPLSETFFPKRYPAQSSQSLVEMAAAKPVVQNAGLTTASLQAFMQTEDAVALTGRLLYPRFFFHNQGIPMDDWPYRVQEYPRLAFFVIGPHGSHFAVLPLSEVPEEVASGADVVLFGCAQKRPIQVLFLLLRGNQEQLYLREPSAPMECPLPAPVCDDNRICR